MYKVDVTNEGGESFKVRSKDYEFAIDTKGAGITPPGTLLAALGSCVGVYIRKYAEGAKIDLKNFKVTVESEFGKEAPFAFKTINVSVDLGGASLDDRRKKALLEFVKNCPVHNTLKGDPAIAIELR